MSIKATPLSVILESDKSYLMNVMDTPGHPNFTDEVCVSMRLTDGVLLVLDAVEGVVMQTKTLIELAIKQNQRIILVINKLDRLILELQLPPVDAYLKLKKLIEEVNHEVKKASVYGVEHPILSP